MDSNVEQLFSRAHHLVNQFRQGDGVDYIDEAIGLDREALELCPPGHPLRYASLNWLANHLWDRYNQLGAMMDLDEAIVLDQEALGLCPPGHSDRSTSLNNFSVRLSSRYAQLGAMEDLNNAIALDREALELRPAGHPDRSSSLNNLAVDLSTRYEQLRDTKDLDEAIVLSREAFELCPPGHSDRSMVLNNFAADLSTRYDHLGVTEDLNVAIALSREALELRLPGHPDRPSSLNNLAVDLSTRFKQVGAMEDLSEAISLSREALALCPPGHPHRFISFTNLAVDLSTRYNWLGKMEDLGEAIVLGREALGLCPPGHPDRPLALNNFAADLSTRYNRLGAIDDLETAIILDREALGDFPPGHRRRSHSLRCLAYRLSTRSRGVEDGEELFSLYTELEHTPQTVSLDDLSAANAWINVAEDFQHPTILLAYETSLRLLIQHLATLLSLPRHLDILKKLALSLAADAFSAGLRKHAPTSAVELLELGRGIFWRQLTQLRSLFDDVTVFRLAGQLLTDEFARLTSLICSTSSSPDPAHHDQAWHLNIQLQQVVNDIRHLPGLSRFLLPPLFVDLQLAARGGPVIIVNASKHSCSALVILLDRDNPVQIPLQITKTRVCELSSTLHTLTLRAKRVDVLRDLGVILRELWDQVVSPVVNFLRTTHPPQSRIWWCPTAEFSRLPLHAAGPYRKGQQNLDDLYISSYTPTLSALIRARRRAPSSSATKRKRIVAIGQAHAIHQKEIASVGVEMSGIARRFEDLVTFTRIEGPECYVSRVSEELGKNQWVHLACHALPNSQRPFESAFALRDGHFTLQRLFQCDLQDPQFAYLSACHTMVEDEDCPDEAVHLASAMQLGGFRSVVGTMWAVDDGRANMITSTFYDHMMGDTGCLDHTRAALALHKTMKTLVDQIPFDQRILYIHVGA